MLGMFYLANKAEDKAIIEYQKFVQANRSLCSARNSAESNALIRLGPKREFLDLIIQSLAFDRDGSCIEMLSAIAYAVNDDQKFSQDVIARLTPIVQSTSDLSLRSLFLSFLAGQKQYRQIIAIAPKFLPSSDVELNDDLFRQAGRMVYMIADAHEEVGDLDQAIRLYEMSSAYQKQLDDNNDTNRSNSLVLSWDLGRVNWKQGKVPQAIALLQSVTKHEQSQRTRRLDDGSNVSFRALAHNLLGEIFQSQGKKAEAKQQFEAAIKATDTFQTPKDNLAQLR
ncbi:MAG: tetratricopeptide repeat protein [Alkalinema sp. RU_4_3]|nr:tetratricopeptide repeat protein [Alkalinema sp. RU_4_3]